MTRAQLAAVLAVALAAMLVACGGNHAVTCAPGTTLAGGACVAAPSQPAATAPVDAAVAAPIAVAVAVTPPAGAGLDCEGAVATGIDRVAAVDNARGEIRDPAVIAKVAQLEDDMKILLAQRCVADHWSTAALACFAAVAQRADLKACIAQLLPPQQDAVHAAMLGLMTHGARMGH